MLGRKPRRRIAVRTLAALAELTAMVPVRIRDTVLADTPARRAASRMVGIRARRAVLKTIS